MMRSAPSCRAVPHHRDALAGRHLGRDRREPSGAEHVRGGQQARDQVVRGRFGSGDQGAVGERDAGALRLGAERADRLGVHAPGLVPGAADLAGVVGGEERADDELAGRQGEDLAAHLLDDADVLVPHRPRPVDLLHAAVGPQVGPAHAGRGEPDDGVGRLGDRRLVALFDADVAGGVEHRSSHGGSSWKGR
jgi:hypothetical protein